MMNIFLNQLVNTPIGQGKYQGQMVDSGQVLVRLPVNDETRSHLAASNCLTPRATLSGLWVFGKEDLS